MAEKKTAAKAEPKPKDQTKADAASSKMGRPTKVSVALIERISVILRAGAYVETAAAMVGLNKSTFYDWLKRGALAEPGAPGIEGLYRDFSDAVERSMAESEFRDLMCIDQAANGRPNRYLMKKGPDGRDTDQFEFDGEGKPILLTQGTKPEWTAAAWRLERKFPKRWGRVDRLELADGDAGTDPDKMDHQQRESKIEEILARRRARSNVQS